MSEYRKAIHEAGHGAIGFGVGIKIEHITILPCVEDGLSLEGLCQWDYGIVAHRKTLLTDMPALMAWAEKEARFLVGGIAAETKHLQDNGLAVEPMNPFAWTRDRSQFVARISDRANFLNLDPDADGERIYASVVATVNDPQVWAGICRMAEALVRFGTIAGEEAERLFKG
jgi:hypothetical protein